MLFKGKGTNSSGHIRVVKISWQAAKITTYFVCLAGYSAGKSSDSFVTDGKISRGGGGGGTQI